MTQEVLTLAMRMVVPLRHEFKFNLEVERLLKDESYEKELQELVSTSTNGRLRSLADDVHRLLVTRWGSEGSAGGLPPIAQPASPDHELASKYRGSLR